MRWHQISDIATHALFGTRHLHLGPEIANLQDNLVNNLPTSVVRMGQRRQRGASKLQFSNCSRYYAALDKNYGLSADGPVLEMWPRPRSHVARG